MREDRVHADHRRCRRRAAPRHHKIRERRRELEPWQDAEDDAPAPHLCKPFIRLEPRAAAAFEDEIVDRPLRPGRHAKARAIADALLLAPRLDGFGLTLLVRMVRRAGPRLEHRSEGRVGRRRCAQHDNTRVERWRQVRVGVFKIEVRRTAAGERTRRPPLRARAVRGKEELGARVRIYCGAQIRQRGLQPADVGVGAQHVDAKIQQRHEIGPAAGGRVQPRQVRVGAEEAGIGAMQIALRCCAKAHGDANERRQPEAVEVARPRHRKFGQVCVRERHEDRVCGRVAPDERVAQLEPAQRRRVALVHRGRAV